MIARKVVILFVQKKICVQIGTYINENQCFVKSINMTTKFSKSLWFYMYDTSIYEMKYNKF